MKCPSIIYYYFILVLLVRFHPACFIYLFSILIAKMMLNATLIARHLCQHIQPEYLSQSHSPFWVGDVDDPLQDQLFYALCFYT